MSDYWASESPIEDESCKEFPKTCLFSTFCHGIHRLLFVYNKLLILSMPQSKQASLQAVPKSMFVQTLNGHWHCFPFIDFCSFSSLIVLFCSWYALKHVSWGRKLPEHLKFVIFSGTLTTKIANIFKTSMILLTINFLSFWTMDYPRGS